MTPQRGRNAGITGLVDIEGSPRFTAKILLWQESLSVQSADRNGRDSASDWNDSRAFRPGGNLVLTGKVQYQGYPLPSAFKGQEGTIQAIFTEKAKQTLSVRVTAATVSLNAEKDDAWKITLTCEILANPTLAGFVGEQPAATDPSKSNRELYSGLTKTRDPNALQSAAAQLFDVWPLTNTDVGEWQAIADTIAAAVTPFTGAKVKTASLAPGRSKEAGQVSIQWSLTDTAEDVINPATELRVDPAKIQTGGQVTAINQTPVIPTVSGQTLVERVTSTQELNDGAIKKTTEYGQRTTAEDLIDPGTFNTIDPLGLDSSGQKTEVFATGSPPSAASPPGGLQAVGSKTEVLNRDMSQRVTTFDVLNSEQKRTYPRIHTTDDANNIEDSAVRAQFWTVGDSPPALPDDVPTNNVKLVNFDDIPITPTRNMRVWLYGEKDSADDQILPNYSTDTDPQALESQAVRAMLDGGSISDPAGLVLRNTKTRPITLALGVNRTLTVKEYGVRSTKDDVEYDGSLNNDDPKDIRDEDSITLVQGSITPTPPTTPTGLKVVRTTTKRLTTAGQYEHKFEYARRDSEDEIEMDASSISNDPADLEDEQIICEVQASATPTFPAVPAGLVLRVNRVDQIHDTKWKHTFRYATRTTQDDIEMGESETALDPQKIKSTSKVTKVFTTDAGAGSDPAPPSAELQVYLDRVQVLNNLKSKRTTQFEVLTSDQEETFPKYRLTIDPYGITDAKTDAQLWISSGGAPSDPGAPSGQLLIGKFDEKVTPDLNIRVWQWGTKTSKNDAEFPHTKTETDPNDLESTAGIATLYVNTSPPSAPATPSGLKLRSSFVIPHTNFTSVKVWQYAKTDTLDDLLNPHQVDSVDPSGLKSFQERAALDSSPGVTGGYVLVATETRKVNDSRNLVVAKGGVQSTADEAANEHGYGEFDALTMGRVTTATVSDNTGSLETIGRATYDANRGSVLFEKNAVRKLTPGKALELITTIDRQFMLDGEIQGGKEARRAVYRGGHVQVWVSQIRARGTKQWEVLVEPQVLYHATGLLSITTRISGNTLSTGAAPLDTTNAELFIGCGVGTLTYLGPRFKTNLANTAPRVTECTSVFRYDSGGCFNEDGIITGWFDTTVDMSTVDEGSWVNASFFGWDAALLPFYDYSAFLF